MRKHQRTALLVVVIVLAIAGLVALFVVAPWHKASAPTTPPAPVPTTTAPVVTTPAPPTTTGVVAVKVDNVTAARPQTGLSAASVVYVEPVEGGLTRLVAVYTTTRPDVVGPVRSARQTDVELLAQYGRPVLAYSGAAPEVLPLLTPLVNASPKEVPSAYFRDAHRTSPHNLYVHPAVLPVSGVDTGVPPAGAALPGGTPVTSQRIAYPAARYDVTWTNGRWELSLDGSPLLSTESGRLSVMTVVVQRVTVRPGTVKDVAGSVSPVAETTGSGPVTVLRDGMSFEGTWSRPTAADPTVFTAPNGTALPVAPGPVWIMLVPR